jgi:hypothetical protein
MWLENLTANRCRRCSRPSSMILALVHRPFIVETERPRSINLSYQSVDALLRERSVYNCNSAHALMRQSISTRAPAKHVQSEGRLVEYSRADASERHGLSH